MKNIKSSQRGFENVAENTQYDDYHIDTKGMGILSVENIIEEIEGRGNQAVLTVQTSDGSTNHSQFGSKDWKEYKDSVNDAGNAITDVWVTEVEGGSYVRNSRQIKSSKGILIGKSREGTGKNGELYVDNGEYVTYLDGERMAHIDVNHKYAKTHLRNMIDWLDLRRVDGKSFVKPNGKLNLDGLYSSRQIKSSIRWDNDDYIVETFEEYGNGEFWVSDKDTAGEKICKKFYSEKEAIDWARNNPINSSRQIKSSQEPLYWGDEHDQRGINMYTREEYIEKYGEEPPEWKRVTEVKTDLWNSRQIKSTRKSDLSEQEMNNLYEIEKREAEEHYNSLSDTDKQMLRLRYGVKNVRDYVKFFVVHPSKLSDDYEFIIDPRQKLNSSLIRSARRPIKSSFVIEHWSPLLPQTQYVCDTDEGLGGTYNVDEALQFDTVAEAKQFIKEHDEEYGGKLKIHEFPIESSRRPIKSSKEYFEMDSYITGRDHMTDFLGFTCDVTKNGDKFEWSNVQSYFADSDFADPESRIYGVYDNQEQFLDDVIYFLDSEQGQDVMQEQYEKAKENGHVWDERGYQVSDDYFYSDPAVELDNWSDNWSENEHIDSSHKITSARYIATDPESGEVLGSADTYEEAVNEWGENVIITDSEAAEGQEEENMGLFQSRKSVNSGMQHKDVSNVSPDSWRDGSELPEKNFSNMSIEVFNQDGDEVFYDFEAKQWYYYPTHKKALVKKWVEKNLVNSSRKITSAIDGGWEVRSSDVPEALDLFVEYFGEEDALEEIAKAMGDNVLQENIEWIAQQWGFGEEIEDLDVWEQYETAKEYMGVSELFNNLTQAAGYDELAADLAFIFRMNDFREWDKYDNEDEDNEDEDDEEIESSLQNSFPVKTVKNIMSGAWTEKQAAQNIAEKQNINVGYAKQILSSWIEQYKPKLIKSGILDIAEDINTEFDIDGDLESWAEQYTNPEGKSNTVGGEMVRAAMQIIYRYNNDGDMIGRGYGNETVNAAARYITEKAEMGVNEQIQKWLDHEERADDYDYDNFIETFTTEIEQILRENPELFQKPNKDDYWNWKEDEDMNYGLDECYLDDGSGNQYWFQLNNDRWTCTGIELDPYSVTYTEGDRIDEGDEYSDEINHTEEFGSFEADGFIYEYAGDDWDDDREEYTSWQITKVVPQDPYCDEGDTFDFYDLEPDELSGFRLFDHNGNEVDERTFLASSLIKSAFFAGDEGEVIIEINDNGKWEFVSLDNTPQGWSTKKNAKVFKSEDAARSSTLMKRLEQAGYSEDVGNLRISVR